jgi:hypothetical protein
MTEKSLTHKTFIRWPFIRRPPTRRALVMLLACLGCIGAVILAVAAPAAASTGHGVLAVAAPPSLTGVIDALRNWLVGLLAAVATLFLTIGGLRYLTAGGDPVQVERAKTALKSAAIGYALAALAPLLVSILTSVVG